MTAVISIAARMSSRRLPGKVLREVGGAPILERIIRSLNWPRFRVVIATTSNPADKPIRDLADRLGVQYVEGSETDLMTRHWQVAQETQANYLLLAGADDPLLDVWLFHAVLSRLEVGDVDYVKTAGWPLGLNVWGWTRDAMEAGDREARSADEREHVVPFWERRPQRFRSAIINRDPDVYDRFRVTVDNPSDLELVDKLVRWFEARDLQITAEGVIATLENRPDFVAINADGLRGTAARDAIYSIAPIDTKRIRDHLAVERRAAQAAIPERGAFAEGQAAALLSLEQWLRYERRDMAGLGDL